MTEIEIYVQGKRFEAHNLEEVDQALTLFKGWNENQPKKKKRYIEILKKKKETEGK